MAQQEVGRRGMRSAVLFALAWAWAALAALLVVLATFASFYDRFPADERIAHAIQDIDVPAFGGFVAFINTLGDTWLYLLLTLGGAFLFVVLRAGWEATFLILTLVARGLNSAAKGWVERPRPSPELVDVTGAASGFGFPSGHTVGTAVLFGMLFFLLPAVVPWRPLRWLLQAGCVLAFVAAGPARVYAGVHWPSDVLAGYLLALLCLLPLAAAYLALRRSRRPDAAEVNR